jgi:predicted metalloprotease with PDZ domain
MIDSAQQAPRAAQSRFIATPEQLAPIVYSTSPARYDSILKHVRYVTTRAGVLYFIPVERKGLGAMWLPASPEQAAQLHNDKAVVIVAIRAGSPAERAGLVAGDAVVKLNGREVDLRAEVEAPPGRITSITIIRASATRTIPVAVAADGSWSLPPPVARRR